MVTRRDYSADGVQAAWQVLIELSHLLAEYRDDIVVVGGWVPELLLAEKEYPHVGSIDVDLALDHRRLQEQGYESIEELLLENGYKPGKQPFMFHQTVNVAGRDITVEVDLLSGQYGGTGRTHRHQRMQGIHALKARGADLVFETASEVTIESGLPESVGKPVTIRVASVVPFLVMKGMALEGRRRPKEKDAYDIYFVLHNYPGGIEAVLKEFEPHVQHQTVREGLENISKHFRSDTDSGPTDVVDFEGIDDPEERDRRRRDAYERVNYLLEQLGIR